MSSSYDSSSDSEAAETEVDSSSNLSQHETSGDEPGDAYANELMANKENGNTNFIFPSSSLIILLIILLTFVNPGNITS